MAWGSSAQGMNSIQVCPYRRQWGERSRPCQQAVLPTRAAWRPAAACCAGVRTAFSLRFAIVAHLKHRRLVSSHVLFALQAIMFQASLAQARTQLLPYSSQGGGRPSISVRQQRDIPHIRPGGAAVVPSVVLGGEYIALTCSPPCLPASCCCTWLPSTDTVQEGQYGQLGAGDRSEQKSPVRVSGSHAFAAIDAGFVH